MIRDAELKDIPRLFEMAVRFNQEYYDFPLSKSKFETAVSNLILSDVGVVLMSDTGLIAGVVTEDPFRDWCMLVELAWYSEGNDGKELLKEFEEVGFNKYRVDEIRMGTLKTSPHVADFLLMRRGYQLIERSYTLTE